MAVSVGRVPLEGVAGRTGKEEAEEEVRDVTVLDGNSRPPAKQNPGASARPCDRESSALEGDAVRTYDDASDVVRGEGRRRRYREGVAGRCDVDRENRHRCNHQDQDR